ncbi:beta-lactamase class D [Streptosporangium becharense]|uniref:Beta-lactamase n=1 Tax=Streptosporangium becharense TaxID=1816182 RepID=A0A7W9MHQ4_9ACTN|nr:class D beta-lactamase [Streptosporangium becharense]MBB2913957.1 beta-lactamase class D [Streptosporangium becharense]MBB5821382.1 beta-lactamase class D [Streptosporangium becharense]
MLRHGSTPASGTPTGSGPLLRTRPRRTLAAALAAISVVAASACDGPGRTSPAPGAPPADRQAGSPAQPQPQPSRTAPAAHTVVRDDLRSVFRDAGVKGAFALLDVDAGRTTVVDADRAARRRVPASTFKIPHSLVALETGAVKNVDEPIPYDGTPQRNREWERDMSLRDAVRVSNVAAFQTVARRIGLRREKTWVNRLGYGNRRIGTAVDRFWLDGPLKISPVEQTRFLARLARRELPAAVRNQQRVREILKAERKGDHTLYAKTGWSTVARPGIGWWVGWVERDGHVYAFALTLDVRADRDAGRRIPVGRELLRRLGVLPGT